MPTTSPLQEEVVCTEMDFLQLLPDRVRPLLAARALLAAGRRSTIGARGYSYISEQAQDLEHFLDDHDAQRNRRFASLRELVASARGFAGMGINLSRLIAGLGKDLPSGDQPTDDAFRSETIDTLGFVQRSLGVLFREVTEECRRLFEGELPEPSERPPQRVETEPQARLPHNLDEEAAPEAERKAAELGAKFLAYKAILEERSEGKHFTNPEEMRRYVLEVGGEEQCRFFETRIHNLLSRYDTYIRGTQLEAQNANLKRLRGYIALDLLLLESMTLLTHFYQRHENDIRSQEAKNLIAGLVDKGQVLDRILNYALHYLHTFMKECAPLAEEMICTYTRQTRVTIEIPAGVAFHVRPVSLVTKVVEHHGTPVVMTIGDATCDAGSVLQVLMAVGAHPDVRQVVFEGDQAVLRDLVMLFESGLGESGRLPKDLKYLGIS